MCGGRKAYIWPQLTVTRWKRLLMYRSMKELPGMKVLNLFPRKMSDIVQPLDSCRRKQNEVDGFPYVGGCISLGGRIPDEMTSRIQRARLAFTNLRHVWGQHRIRLSIKARVYTAAMRSVLLCDSETWPLRTDDVQELCFIALLFILLVEYSRTLSLGQRLSLKRWVLGLNL